METGQHNAAIFRVAQCNQCRRIYQQDGNDPCPFCGRADLLERVAKLKDDNGRLWGDSVRADHELKELKAARDHAERQLSYANAIICDVAAALGVQPLDRSELADKVRDVVNGQRSRSLKVALDAAVNNYNKSQKELQKQCTRVRRLQHDLRQMNATMVQISNLALTETKIHMEHWQTPEPDYEDISKLMNDVPIITNDEVQDDGD